MKNNKNKQQNEIEMLYRRLVSASINTNLIFLNTFVSLLHELYQGLQTRHKNNQYSLKYTYQNQLSCEIMLLNKNIFLT